MMRHFRVHRHPDNPIIRPHMDDRMGDNINGPSLIRVPDWVENRLGSYYLYFAHHNGQYIRLAYADTLDGPWQIYSPGVLALSGSHFAGHIASPDVHVDHEEKRFRLYYHGCDRPTGADDAPQPSRVALSDDGLHFRGEPEMIGDPYMRIFEWDRYTYALSMPGIFYRSRDGLTGFERGPTLFTAEMRHCAVQLNGHQLAVFYTNAGDCPERILHVTIDLRPDWHLWTTSTPETVLAPELAYEGGNLPLLPSERGMAPIPVRQLRDPAIYAEDGRTWLLYCVAGENGIALAELEWVKR